MQQLAPNTFNNLQAMEHAMNKPTIGRLGVWTWLEPYPFPAAIELAQTLEKNGYGALWLPEAFGRDPFVSLTVLAGATSELRLATGIANIYARDPMAMNAARNSLHEASGGRLVLGLGVSHAEIVTPMRNHDYGKPVATMSRYLDGMAAASYSAAVVEPRAPVILAALRDRMLGLARDKADGAHPYFVTPEHTARARTILGPDKLLAPEQKVLLMKNASEVRPVARSFMALYLTLQNYRNNLLSLGFTETDLEHGGSDRLVDAIVAWGDETAIQKRIEAHWANGADHVCIQPLRPDGQPGFDPRAIAAFATKA